MPATSQAQRRLMAIAEHHPGEVYAKNRSVLEMSKGQLHDFAKTKESKLPYRHKKGSGGGGGSPCKIIKREGNLEAHQSDGRRRIEIEIEDED